MSLLDDNFESNESTILIDYVKTWLNKYSYSREAVITTEEINVEPDITVRDGNIIDLEFPSNWKFIIQDNVTRIPTEYFRFGKINCALSLGENFKNFPGAIETLEGLPTEVGGFYDANWCTSLKSLKGLPEIIHGCLFLQGIDFKIDEHIYLPKVIEGNLYININTQEEADVIFKNHLITGNIYQKNYKFNKDVI